MKKERRKKVGAMDAKVKYKKGMLLPSVGWLIKNGFSDLADCMKKHPEAFKHIKQDKEENEIGRDFSWFNKEDWR